MTVEREGTATEDLRIEVNVRNSRTMTQFRLRKSRKLTFRNASMEGSLVVKPKRGSPFVDNCGATLDQVTVAPGCEVTVGIDPSFKGNEFLYSAQIGNNEKEDPIVILE